MATSADSIITSGTMADPVTLTWVGGGSNLASDPAEWSPAVAPTAGDTLSMPSGTMNLDGNALAANTLYIPFDASVDINTGHAARLDLDLGPEPDATANIDVHGRLTLNAQVTSGYLNVSGGTINFIGTSGFHGFKTQLDSNLVGSGTLDLTGGNANGELMEVNGAVGGRLTFNISGTAPDASLQIDHPNTFFGLIELPQTIGLGHVAFMGIQATSADLFDGILLMFDGSKPVDATRISGGSDLHLQQTTTGVLLTEGAYSDVFPGSGGTPIPIHTFA
jgi:hypothetical protein